MKWAERSTLPAVCRAFEFTSQAETLPHLGSTRNGTHAAFDSTMKPRADGKGSLCFTVPPGEPIQAFFALNFTPGTRQPARSTGDGTLYPVQFGAGEEFYIQWRQRMDRFFLNPLNDPSGYSGFLEGAGPGRTGWKTIIISEGDRPDRRGVSCPDTIGHLVVTNGYGMGFPQMYHSCGLKDGRYHGLGVGLPNGDIDYQPHGATPYCSYRRNKLGDKTGCWLWRADNWQTFQIGVKVGTWYLNDRIYHQDSTVKLWCGDEGQPSSDVISRTDYDLVNLDAARVKYGKVWLLPYMTGKSMTEQHAIARTWYADLIISRERIPDPTDELDSSDTTAPAAPALELVSHAWR